MYIFIDIIFIKNVWPSVKYPQFNKKKFNDKLYFSRLNVRRVKIRKVWIWMLLATEFYFSLILETTFQDHSNIQTDLIQWTQKWLPDVPTAKNLIQTKKVVQIILISFRLGHI